MSSSTDSPPREPGGQRQGPLAGLVVVDLTQFLAGPYATQILADMGARIIKVEPPAGDSTRALPPYFVGDTSAYFMGINRSKESIVIDLKHPEARDLILDMVRRADVVVENFRPGVLARLGLGYDRLAEANPGIVLCSISGFGQDGPDCQLPAYDAVVQALSGVLSITGVPGERPVRTGVPLGDLAAGMFGAIGLLAALHEKERTGRGRHVDVAMLDSQIALLSYLGVYYLVSGDIPGPQGRGHVSIPTYRSFRCADGIDVMVTANTERMWRGLCAAIEQPALVDDPRFADNERRHAHRDELWPILDPCFLSRASAEWLERLVRHGVPVAPVNTVDRALSTAQAQHRHMTVTVDDGAGRSMRMLGTPIKFPGLPDDRMAWPPGLGAQTRSVLSEFLGLPKARVDAVIESGVTTPVASTS